MKHLQLRRNRALWIAVVSLVACGDNLLRDPSFDLWCGNALCAPWESTGKITREKTWHRSDFGVELGDGATLTQLSTHDSVSCIEFEIVADVAASAQVWLEMDFNDDGSSEFKQQIPESRWAKLRFDARTPRWYEGVRFILRKEGHGRALLAQITAVAGADCTSNELPDMNRINGAACTQAAQCAGGVCEALAQSRNQTLCGECGTDAPCPEGQRCGLVRGVPANYAACVPLELQTGALCSVHSDCASQHCQEPLRFGGRSCVECSSDAECPADQVCGLRVTELGATRACRAAAERALGELCASNPECASGHCVGNVCSECEQDSTCDNGIACAAAPVSGSWFWLAPALCADKSGVREQGEPCVEHANCASGKCDEVHTVCYLCDDALESCGEPDSIACVLPRKIPGVCR